MLGNILECGRKRSATPLCLAPLRGNRESLDALSALEDHIGAKKAPSLIRFVGAVQNAGLMGCAFMRIDSCENRVNEIVPRFTGVNSSGRVWTKRRNR